MGILNDAGRGAFASRERLRIPKARTCRAWAKGRVTQNRRSIGLLVRLANTLHFSREAELKSTRNESQYLRNSCWLLKRVASNSRQTQLCD